MSNPEGIDVSHHNGTVGWAQVKNAGISFAFIKCSEGNGFVDPSFQANVAGARAHGIMVGAYHYYIYNIDPTAQANHFLHTMGALHDGDLPPTVDVEAPTDGSGASQGVQANIARLQTFLDAVEARTGRKPIIYTYPSVWQTTMGNTSHFVGYPLWIANYGVNHPTVPGHWPDYKFWQYSDRGSVPGALHVDRDVFNGSLAELQVFAGGTPPPPDNRTAIERYHDETGGFAQYGNALEVDDAGRIKERTLPLPDVPGAPFQLGFYQKGLIVWRSDLGASRYNVGTLCLDALVKLGVFK